MVQWGSNESEESMRLVNIKMNSTTLDNSRGKIKTSAKGLNQSDN